jgi:hypothetical protein
MNKNKYEINYKVFSVYYNSVGSLVIRVIGLPEELCDEKTKIFYKCEDGRMTVMIKNSDFNFKKNFSIFFSKSMRANFNDCQILNKKGEIFMRMSVTRDLLSKDCFLEKIGGSDFHISECFSRKLLLNEIQGIVCSNCKNVLVDFKNLFGQENLYKLIFNFNYDYFGNLEMLSCHESDIDNIIPNLDDKLKSM